MPIMNEPMKSNAQITSVSRKALRVSYILSALPVVMLLMSAVMKFAKPAFVVEGFAHLGLPEKLAFGLGILELSCTVAYVIPQSAVLGAILLTGYLGGAILTHLRVGEPIFMQIIFGVAIWGGLYLRDPRLRAFIPFRAAPAEASTRGPQA